MKRLVASLVALTFGITLLSAPMVALSVPGNTCNPAAGHGRSGCHRVTVAPQTQASVPTSPTVTVLSGPSSVKVKKTIEVTGTVAPGALTGTVTIVKTRLVGKKWKSAGTAKAAFDGTSFSYKFRPTKKGKWRLVAKYSGGVVDTTTYAASKSGIKNIRVR